MNFLTAPTADADSSINLSTGADHFNQPETHQLVFIDSSVADAEQLAQSVVPGIEAILLDSTQNGIAQITAALAGRTNIGGVQLIGHGSSGSLRLGNTVLNQETIAALVPLGRKQESLPNQGYGEFVSHPK